MHKIVFFVRLCTYLYDFIQYGNTFHTKYSKERGYFYMAKNPNAYDRAYKNALYQIEKGQRDDLTDVIHEIKFGTKTISPTQFKNMYKGKIETKEQEFILNNCLDLISMVNAAKECLAVEGAYVKNVTGSLKVNPAQKELRENLKAFNTQLELLNNVLVKEDEDDLAGWLEDE